MAGKATKIGNKHHLLVYRFIAGRYRPAGVLLFVIGIIALLPWLMPPIRDVLRLDEAFLSYTQLAYLGAASMFAGAFLWIMTIYMQRKAYVQCLPEYMVINTASHRVVVAYQRINTVQPVQVNKVFNVKEIKGREQTFIKPLSGDTALEVELKEFPVPEKRLRRHFSRFLLSPRDKGFVFIVRYPSQLSLEISTYTQNALDQRAEEQQRYLDPIERLKYQESGKMYG
jgi:hypothetical protein